MNDNIVTITSKEGVVRYTGPIMAGSKRKFTLMQEDYVLLKFSLDEPLILIPGDRMADARFGEFELCREYQPVYNKSTGGYDYEVRMDAHYWKWKNKIFKYTPEKGGQEASWNLTAPLDVQLSVFVKNLETLGYGAFSFNIDNTVENKAVLMSYDNTNLLDALFSMASKDKWNCDCWVLGSTIHFGRCESGIEVELKQDVNADIERVESKGTFATRIYAFGGTNNIPSNYRQSQGNVTLNGIVQKRLMLPEGTPYIDAYRYRGGEKVYIGEPDYEYCDVMPNEEAIESVVIFDSIYPKKVGIMSDVSAKEHIDNIENNDGTVTQQKRLVYRYRDSSITFSESYIIPGQELKIYMQSGKLNGMVFSVKFNPDKEPEKLKDGRWNPAAQLWEIVANDSYGRSLPDDVLFPANNDKFVLTGFDIKMISDTVIPETEKELKREAEKCAARKTMDDSTFTVTLFPSWVVKDEVNHTFGVGQRVKLVAPELFKNGRSSRVIGYEFALDIPYDHPVYTIGESAAYSRIGELKEKLESLTFKGQTYEGGKGGSVYIIRSNDQTIPTDSNVFSALRTLISFLRKDQPDQTTHLLKLLGGVWVDGGIAVLNQGAQYGDYAGGLTGHGGKIDGKGYGELRGLRLWEFFEVPELRYNQVKVFVGIDWQCAGAGIVESVIPDKDPQGYVLTTGTAKLKLEKGQYGAIAVDDIVMGIFHMGNNRDAATDSDDSKGNFNFAGFATIYFRITEVIGANNGTFKYSLRPGFSVHPQPQMTFACYGNFTKPERQTSTYRTRTYTRRLWKQNNWEIAKDNIAAQDGDLSNLSAHGMQMQGYSAYLNNIYFSGTIQSLKKPDGSTIKIKEFVGAWVLGTKYQYYQEVTHNGSSWLCVSEKGTSTEPGADNPDWLCTSSKGADGEGITNFGPWRSGVTIPKLAVVTMGGKSFLSKKATTNPPMWMFTDASGNRYAYASGGYVLTGECNTEDYSLLTQDGEDGVDGKDGVNGTDGINGADGTSIVWKGAFNSHPTNPQNGWAYRNTLDKKSYVYQDGQWYQMTIDGVDGQNGAPGQDGIGITWKGDMVSAPANPQKNWVYRDKDNGRVYIYNGTAWELMVVDGSDGIEGAPGHDGLSVFITYHDSVTAPQTPTGNGTTGGWHHNATASVRWMSQKVSASVSEGAWGGPIEIKGEQGLQGKDGADGAPGPQGEKGEKGDGYTHLGSWTNGMLVPRMGVVRMGGTSYVAKSATYNPPCEVYRDANNNCYTYAGGGYVLTGRINIGEYDILAEGGADGAPGADGKPGADGAPGRPGIQGCIIRDSEWNSAGVQYRNDEALTSGTRYIDIALVATDANQVGYDCYKCKATHNSNSSNKPGTSGGGAYWELMSNVGPIFTSLLIAKNAKIKFLQGNQLLIQKSNGTVAAGISGSDTGDRTRFWAGNNVPDTAPFAVNESGVVTAEKFRTGRQGCRLEAENGVVNVFGTIARNIQFGVNAEGMAVLKYFDNNGNMLYDLGPNGISKVDIREESWTSTRWTYLASNLDSVFDDVLVWRKACTPEYNTGADVHQYLSKMVAGVMDDPGNDGKYFTAMLKDPGRLVADGWYIKTFPVVNPAYGHVRPLWNGSLSGSGAVPADTHPKNPTLNGYENIYYDSVFQLVNGRIVKRQMIYYNLQNQIL